MLASQIYEDKVINFQEITQGNYYVDQRINASTGR